MDTQTGGIYFDEVASKAITEGRAVEISQPLAQKMAPVPAPDRAAIAREIQNLAWAHTNMSLEQRETLALKICNHKQR